MNNVLIIGNGFDLAHGLPTSYKDFLYFIDVVKSIESSDNEKNFQDKISEKIGKVLIHDIKSDEFEEIKKFKNEMDIENNIWINLFENRYDLNGWVDFENEISLFLSVLETKSKFEDMEKLIFPNNSTVKKMNSLSIVHELAILQNFIRKKYNIYGGYEYKPTFQKNYNFNDLVNELENLFSDLIKLMNFYFSNIIPKCQIEFVLPQIEKINFDSIINFNYTNTFFKKYYNSSLKNISFFFVHGYSSYSFINTYIYDDEIEKPVWFPIIGSNKIVLGIPTNENFKDESDHDFIFFKKFFQRVIKKTDNNYLYKIKDVLSKSKKSPTPKATIIGHSLDISDYEALNPFLNKFDCTIYYHNEDSHRSLITNLTKFLGGQELLSKISGSSNNTIELVQLKIEDLEN